MGKNPTVSIIIINFKVASDIFVLLSTLEKATYPLTAIELIIVNNLPDPKSSAKLEKTLERWKAKCARVVSIANEKNVGLSFALNQALKAVSKKSEYIWRIDNDLKLRPDSLTKLVEVIQADSTIGLVGSKANAYDNEDQFVDGGWKLIWPIGYAQNFDAKVPTVCDYISGRSELVRTEIAKQIGYLGDLALFAYFEDMDFCIQVQQQGYTVVYVPDSLVYHKFDPSGEYLPYKVRLMARNRIVFMRKNAGALWNLTFFLTVWTVGIASFLFYLIRKRVPLKQATELFILFVKSCVEGYRADLSAYFLP